MDDHSRTADRVSGEGDLLLARFRALYPSDVLALDERREFDPARDAEFFESLPQQPGVILLEMKSAGAEPYLAQTADIRRAAERLLREPEAGSKRLNLREAAKSVSFRRVGSKFERNFAFYGHARALFPQKYKERARIRPSALLKVNLRNSYPRCYVTRRVRADEGFYFGPFPSRRAAEAFNEGILDLFKIRRCQIKIRRDPTFPGCVYSEMKMCMAPCFAGCTKQEYDADVAALVAMLDSAGAAMLDPLEREREAASEGLDFERAAALHKRVEKVKTALRGLPDVTRRIDKLDAVILQRGAGEKSVLVFPLRGGIFGEPLLLNFGDLSEPKSVEASLREALASEKSGDDGKSLREKYGLTDPSAELTEHLSLVARWFYSNPRDGEILFRDGDWPYRRILRACARILTPPPAAHDAPPAAAI